MGTFAVLLFTGIAVVPLLVGSQVLVYFGRRQPHLLASFVEVLRLRTAPSLGLAVSRGLALGLGALGVFAGVERLGIVAGYPPSAIASQMFYAGVWSMAGSNALGSLFLGGAFAFVILLAKRRINGTPALALLASLTVAATMFDQPWNPASVTGAALMGALFVVTFLAFDFITVMAAVAAAGTLGVAFTMTKVTEPIGNGSAWLLITTCAAVFAASAWIGYRPLWDRLRSRVGEALD